MARGLGACGRHEVLVLQTRYVTIQQTAVDWSYQSIVERVVHQASYARAQLKYTSMSRSTGSKLNSSSLAPGDVGLTSTSRHGCSERGSQPRSSPRVLTLGATDALGELYSVRLKKKDRKFVSDRETSRALVGTYNYKHRKTRERPGRDRIEGEDIYGDRQCGFGEERT